MGLETATYIDGLVTTNPAATDPKSQGDDHLRLIKSTVKATFPNITGAVTPTHTELNYVDGVTSSIQTQLDSKGGHAGQVWTGTQDFTGATITVPTQSLGNSTTNAASTAFVADGLALKANLASPAFTGTPTAPTPSPGDDSTKLATTEFVNQAAFSSVLPNQSGNGGKYLKTDGTSASWAGAFTGDSGGGGVMGLVPAPAAGQSSRYLKGDGTWAVAAFAPDVIIQDQKPAGTGGGSAPGGATWANRTLNTIVRNNGSVGSLASNQVTLGAGTYFFRGRAAFSSGGLPRTRLRIYNATDASVEAYGEAIDAQSSMITEVVAFVTIAASKAFALQYWTSNNPGDLTLGSAASTLSVEVYATLEITKVA